MAKVTRLVEGGGRESQLCCWKNDWGVKEALDVCPSPLSRPPQALSCPQAKPWFISEATERGVFTQGNVDLFYGDVWALRKLDRKMSLLCALSLCHLTLKTLMEGVCEVR